MNTLNFCLILLWKNVCKKRDGWFAQNHLGSYNPTELFSVKLTKHLLFVGCLLIGKKGHWYELVGEKY